MSSNRTQKLVRAIIPILIFIIIYLIPVPKGLNPKAWYEFAIFASVIAAMITRPIPNIESVAVLAGLAVTGLMGIASIGDILSGYRSSAPWLILAAFLIAIAFLRTGFASRIAYMLIRFLGKNILGVTYALTFTDFIVGPVTPSTTARSAGIILPITVGIIDVYKSKSERIGKYLCITLPFITMVTSASFITAMVANPLVVSFAKQILKVDISWSLWTLGMLPIAIIMLIILPLVLRYLVDPGIYRVPEAPEMAKQKLREMGPMSRKEKVCLLTYILAIALWATSQWHGIDATVVGFLAGLILILGGAIAWRDVLETKAAWDTVFWLGGMTSLATILDNLGFFKYIANGIAASVRGYSAMTILFIFALVVIYTGYGFASLTARVSAIIPAFLSAVALANLNPVLATLVFGYAISIGGILMPFSAASSPPWYGLGYVSFPEWTKTAFIIELIMIVIFFGIGIPYWMAIGLFG